MSERLTKVHVDLPNHWKARGEAMWAAELGENSYELRNIPFLAYGLNFLDVVEAIELAPDLKPSIRRVLQRSGHQTLRVVFNDKSDVTERAPLLNSLAELGASYEGVDDKYYALDIEPQGDYQGVCNTLYEWEMDGLLSYETCEARVEGSFDDALDDDCDKSANSLQN